MNFTADSASSLCASGACQPRSRRLLGILNGGVLLALLAVGAAVYFTPLKTWLAQGQLVKDQLALFGLAAPAVFTAGAALLTVLGLPRLLLCSLGGMVFGFSWGLVWSQLGTLLGSYAIFLCVRGLGQDYALHRFARLRRFSEGVQSRGLLSVVLIRQLPLSGFYNTVLIGLAPVNHCDFLLGSVLGFLPLGVSACLLGAGLAQANWVAGLQYAIMGLACSVAMGFALSCLAKRNAVAAQR